MQNNVCNQRDVKVRYIFGILYAWCGNNLNFDIILHLFKNFKHGVVYEELSFQYPKNTSEFFFIYILRFLFHSYIHIPLTLVIFGHQPLSQINSHVTDARQRPVKEKINKMFYLIYYNAVISLFN